MTSCVQSSVNSFVSERMLHAKQLADSEPQAAPKRFYEKMLEFRALGITSLVTAVLGNLANAMASTVPVLSLVGRTFKVMAGAGLIATGIVGLMGLLWGVYCLIHIDDIRNVHQTPFVLLFSDFRVFSQGYKSIHGTLRGQEIGQNLTYLERNTIERSLDKDEVLSQYRCPITGEPIRHIAIDPHSGKMFERTAIVAWIERYHTSPLTTEPLRVEELLPSPETQLVIDNRLRVIHEQRTHTSQRRQTFLTSRQERREVNRESGNDTSTKETREGAQQ